MTDRRCGVCGAESRLNAATVLDSSGAVLAHICDPCKTEMEADRCVFCGSREPPKRAEGLYFCEEKAPAKRICDGCRNDLLADGREVPLA